jgi:peptide chain release factor 2
LEQQVADPSLWEDPERAQRLTRRLSRIRADLDRFESLDRRLADARAMEELLSAETDRELSADLERSLSELEAEMEKLELATLLSGEYDANDAIATLHAGAGGTESQDWAEMLLRMYLRWAEREHLGVELDEVLPGEEAGIKSATFIVSGTNAYGLLSTEHGVHRLVRISPFDAQKRRHTSFASLDVIPLLEETDEDDIEIDPKDLRIDVYRSTGPGGQSVNTTDSAVRITHLPTGIVVECQDERSQHKNRSRAMSLLRARLLASEREKQQSQQAQSRKLQVGSGDRSERIRTYNFPQGRVTDHRINLTLYKLDDVMKGNLDELIGALNQEHQAEELAQQVE